MMSILFKAESIGPSHRLLRAFSRMLLSFGLFASAAAVREAIPTMISAAKTLAVVDAPLKDPARVVERVGDQVCRDFLRFEYVEDVL